MSVSKKATSIHTVFCVRMYDLTRRNMLIVVVVGKGWCRSGVIKAGGAATPHQQGKRV